jgi:cation diffusion facilitator family transporter
MDGGAKIVLRVTLITLAANILLAGLKTLFGLLFGNLPVIADAVHSFTDVATSVLVIVGVFISSPKPDKMHNYGHEKVESLIVLFFSVVLIGTGAFLIYQGITGIIAPKISRLNYYLLGVTIASILAKEAMFWYTRHFAKKINSQMLRADAWHHRSDSFSSVAVLAGLVVGIFTKTNIAENIAVIVVAVLIIKVAFDILVPAINQLLDKCASEQVVQEIRKITLQVGGVIAIDEIKTRLFGNTIYTDIEIAVDKNLTVIQSHNIAQKVHDTLESTETLHIKHCNVHVNPA